MQKFYICSARESSVAEPYTWVNADILRIQDGAAVFYVHGSDNPIAVYGLNNFYVVQDR